MSNTNETNTAAPGLPELLARITSNAIAADANRMPALANCLRDARDALAAQPAPVDGDRRPFAFCCAEGGGRIEGCSCVNKDHGFAVFPGKRPSVESLWQAFWATPHDEREWNRPIGTDGKPMPMTLISFKYEVVRAAFEIDAKRDSQEESK